MKIKLSAFFLVGFLACWLTTVSAAEALAADTKPPLNIKGGVFKQGGYVYGTTHPDATLKLLQTKIKVGEDGRFIAGLHRYFPEQGVFKVARPGEKIQKVPFEVESRDYPTQHIKGVKRKHVTPDPEQVKRSRREAAAIRASRAPFTALDAAFGGFSLPVKGVPETGFYGSRRTFNGEERSWHKGLDLAAPTGTPIKAPADGVVTEALPNTFFNGNIMTINHGYGLFSIYAHLDSMALEKGAAVREGEVIGTVGATGRATGPHLHWGVYWHNVALDPQLFLRHNGGK